MAYVAVKELQRIAQALERIVELLERQAEK